MKWHDLQDEQEQCGVGDGLMMVLGGLVKEEEVTVTVMVMVMVMLAGFWFERIYVRFERGCRRPRERTGAY